MGNLNDSLSSANTQYKIMFYGDSLVEGYNLQPNERFTNFISLEIMANQMNWQVLNYGKCGDMISSTLPRLKESLEIENPHLVCLCIGGNDFFEGRWKELPTVKKELATLIETVRTRDINLVLLGIIPPAFLASEVQSYPAIAQRLAFFTMYEELAKATGVIFIKSIFEGIPLVDDMLLYQTLMDGNFMPNSIFEKEYFLDEVHPNALGHSIIAEKLYSALAPVMIAIEIQNTPRYKTSSETDTNSLESKVSSLNEENKFSNMNKENKSLPMSGENKSLPMTGENTFPTVNEGNNSLPDVTINVNNNSTTTSLASVTTTLLGNLLEEVCCNINLNNGSS
jgi:lysophospholipase L1-like esterase